MAARTKEQRERILEDYRTSRIEDEHFRTATAIVDAGGTPDELVSAIAHAVRTVAFELEDANACVGRMFLDGNRIIGEREEAWTARDVLRAENRRLQAAIRELTTFDGAEQHDGCTCRVCEARGVNISAIARELQAFTPGWSSGMAPVVRELVTKLARAEELLRTGSVEMGDARGGDATADAAPTAEA